MTQLTFAEAEYQNKKRKTRRELFLEKMDGLIPWAKLEKKLRKHYPKGGEWKPALPAPHYASGALPAIVLQPQ